VKLSPTLIILLQWIYSRKKLECMEFMATITFGMSYLLNYAYELHHAFNRFFLSCSTPYSMLRGGG
jgi:NADH:ubiquinone oxidoreductase subunit 3 (subunit A)